MSKTGQDVTSQISTGLINLNDLKTGDLIFTVSNVDRRFSGHVAICYKPHSNPKHFRIIHATDCPTYFSLSITKLNPSDRLVKAGPMGSHYEVFRCIDQKLLSEALRIMNIWAKFYVRFSAHKLATMEKQDYHHDNKKRWKRLPLH